MYKTAIGIALLLSACSSTSSVHTLSIHGVESGMITLLKSGYNVNGTRICIYKLKNTSNIHIDAHDVGSINNFTCPKVLSIN